MKILEGNTIAVKTVGNTARHGGSKIVEHTIGKVGRKYFEINGLSGTKFSLKDFKEVTIYSKNFELYESVQEIQDIEESCKLVDLIRDRLDRYGNARIPLPVAKEIVKLLNIKTD